jgi:broad-specificity NMP kinase
VKIGIAGCSGTGKSVLAEKLAEKLDIPFLPSKDITGEILRRDEFDYGSGQQIEKFLATNERQRELLRKSIKQQSVESFVTDRTAIDLASYAILEMDDSLKTQKHLDKCEEFVKIYDVIFFCSWESVEIIDNKKRTLDPWYQFAVHSVQHEVSNLFNANMHVFEKSDLDERLEEALEHIQYLKDVKIL